MALVNIPTATLYNNSLGGITKAIKLNMADPSIGALPEEIEKVPTLVPYHNAVSNFFDVVAELLTNEFVPVIPYKSGVQFHRSSINGALKVIRTNMWTKAGLPIPTSSDFAQLTVEKIVIPDATIGGGINETNPKSKKASKSISKTKEK